MFKINIRIWSIIPFSRYLQIASYRLVYAQMCEECFCEHFLQGLNPISIKYKYMCGAHTTCAITYMYIYELFLNRFS